MDFINLVIVSFVLSIVTVSVVYVASVVIESMKKKLLKGGKNV